MPIKIEIPNKNVKYLNEEAKAHIKILLAEHSSKILKEATRLEANLKTTQGNPEITSSMIEDASNIINRKYSKPIKTRLALIAKFLIPIGSFFAGKSYENVTKPWGLPSLVILVILVMILITIEYINE